MERVSFVKNGELRLPPGFRFHPTDEELVVQYLKRKALSSPLPFPLPFPSFIPEVDLICNSDPWDLPGGEMKEQERYMFSRKEAKYRNGSRSNRATRSGYWKATGLDKQITSSTSKVLVGMKKTLVFYRGKAPHGSRTDWIMHEYRLLPSSHSPHHHTININWLLCRVFFKKRPSSSTSSIQSGNKDNNYNNNYNYYKSHEVAVFYDFLQAHNNRRRGRADLNLAPPASSSSSATSAITHEHLHQQEQEQEESSSCCNSNSNSNSNSLLLFP